VPRELDRRQSAIRATEEIRMIPHLNSDPQPFARHPQRPWRPVETEARRPARTAARTYCAPVVRELPPQREYHAALGTW